LVEQGADLLDVGGESTRPGSDAVSGEEEWRRIGTVIHDLAAKVDVPLSIDTMKAAVAAKAIDAGASLVNDVSGLRDPAMVRAVAERKAGVVVMHMSGNPKTMQEHPQYADVAREVRAFLADRIRALEAAGVRSDAIAVDPGFGFGKNFEQNYPLLRRFEEFHQLRYPLLAGTSRKSFVGRMLSRNGQDAAVDQRLHGTLATEAAVILKGAHIVRTHDVRASVDAARAADVVA